MVLFQLADLIGNSFQRTGIPVEKSPRIEDPEGWRRLVAARFRQGLAMALNYQSPEAKPNRQSLLDANHRAESFNIP